MTKKARINAILSKKKKTSGYELKKDDKEFYLKKDYKD